MGSKLVVLGDSVVSELLISLKKDEILAFQQDLCDSLRSISVGDEGQYQPPPGIINRPSGQKVLFRPFTSPNSVGTKIIVDPAPKKDPNEEEPKRDGLHGVLVVCDDSGFPKGLVNAEAMTGFRTSLCALIPYVWRKHTDSIVVFGAGKQALWHIRLALALRGAEIKSITVVNRSVEKAQAMIKRLEKENEKYWNSAADIMALPASASLETVLSTADVVFCTVPTTSILFPMEAVLGKGGREKKPLITAIGSWQPNMIEVDPKLVQHVARTGPSDGSPYGAVLVDDLEEGMKSSAELIQSDLKPEEMLEIGKVVDWRHGSTSSPPNFGREHLDTVLSEGFVVYKSIGVSVTDLVTGSLILQLAGEKGLGHSITDF